MGYQFLDLSNLGRNGAARWLGGTLIVLFFWFILGSIFTVPFLILSGALATGDMLGGDPFWTYIGVSVGFIFILLGLWIVVRFLHRRPFLTLVTPAPRLSWMRLAHGFGVWLLLLVIIQAIEFIIYPERAQYTFDPATWLFFLPFVLILTPIQTSAEELLFRGYWLQGTGRLTRNFILLCAINGLLFAAPHMLNPEVLANPGSTLWLFLSYLTTGAALALFTLRDNRLELALGAHAANNLFAGLVVNYSDSALPIPSVFTNPTLDAPFGLVALLAVCVAFYFVVFRLLDHPLSPRTDKLL